MFAARSRSPSEDRARSAPWRARLLSSPRFQRWAARFPLTRPVARRRARQLFDLTAGFAYSQVLVSCERLGLLPALQAGPRSTAALAADCGLAEPAMAQLLVAAEALELVRRRGADYVLGDLGAALLGNPGARAMVAHHDALYADLADPVALLRQRGDTRLSRFWPYAGTGGDRQEPLAGGAVQPYSALMASSQDLLLEDLLAVLPLRGRRCLLDLGGGDGHFLAAVLARWPQLRGQLFDLPAVAALAREKRSALCDSGRLQVAAGDMFRDPLPGGADIATLVRVLHDHDDPAALALLRRLHAALPPGGRVVVAEPLAGTRQAPGLGAYFSLYLWAMGSGRPRTREEVFGLLRTAGFRRCRELSVSQPLVTRVLTANVN